MAEAEHWRPEVEEEAEQWRPEVEEEAEPGLKASATVDVANGHNLDKSGDVMDILGFDDIGANVDGPANGDESSASHVETGESSKNVGEVVEEEVVELEFEKVKPKLATHSMHCPKCKSEITKVILRRKVISYRPRDERPVPVAPELDPEPKNLLGCFSCLSLFTCSENGCFNPFDIFRRPKTPIDPAIPSSEEGKAKVVVRENESCFSMFWIIGKEKEPKDPQSSEPTVVNRPPVISSSQVQPSTYVTETTIIPKGNITFFDDNEGGANTGLLGDSQVENEDTTINIANEPEPVVVAPSRGRSWLGYDGLLAEILKSIVYGGLMEVIASLGVVASAAASDATTLTIISVALASLMGGVFVIGHNLWDLRDDCYKDSSNNKAVNKYKELLGQVNYFPLHTFFAILSFLLFGMIPPMAYGYAFHETNDKDYTVAAVAIASLICVALLAIFKAYINKCTVFDYFKTMVYYVTTAVSVSGVSYVAGNLVTRLMEEYGLFGPSSGGGMSFFPDAAASLASF